MWEHLAAVLFSMLYICALEVYVNWMIVLGSSGERLDNVWSCLAEGKTSRFRERSEECFKDHRTYFISGSIRHINMTFTFQPSQRIKAALLVTGKEAVAIQEIRPGHFNGLKGVGAVLPQCLTCAPARFHHLVISAGWGEYWAAHKTNLRGALPIEKTVDDA